jgi:hypothetical protein
MPEPAKPEQPPPKDSLDACLNEFENFLSELDEPAKKKKEAEASGYNSEKYFDKTRKNRSRSRSRSRSRGGRSRSRSRGRRSRSGGRRRSRSRSGGRRRSGRRSRSRRRSRSKSRRRSGYNPERRDPDRYYD